MKKRFISLFATISGIALSSAPALPAQAANLNTSAIGCQQDRFQGLSSPLTNRIDYVDPGVVNLSTVGTSVLCPVTRSPLAATATTGSFFVDGDNYTGASTFCIMSSYDFLGNFVGSRGFTTSAPRYDEFVSFPSSLLGFYNYVTLMCVLPAFNTANSFYGGKLRGVTALQP